MGQTCGGLCTSDTRTTEFDTQRPSLGNHTGMDTDDLHRLIRIQALVRSFIIRRRYLACKRNPVRFQELFPQVGRKVPKGQATYKSAVVDKIIAKLGPFRYDDP